MSKLVAIRILVALVLANLAVQGYLLYRVAALASQGAESHTASCAYKSELEQRVVDDKAYLSGRPAALRKKYGKALAHIPRSTIVAQEKATEAALGPLGRLHC